MAVADDFVARWQDPEYVANFAHFTEEVACDPSEWIKRLALGSGSTVLDLGCGEAKVLAALSSHARRRFGIDVSPHMAGLARRRLNDQGAGNTSILLGDFRHLCVAPGSVDAVLSVGAIHHAPDSDRRQIFSQIFGALKQGGVFYLADDTFNFPREELEGRIAEIHAEWEGYFGSPSWDWMKAHLAGDDFENTPFLSDLKEMISASGLEIVSEDTGGRLDGVDLTAIKQ